MRLSAKLLKEYLRLLALADDQLPCNPAYDEDKVVSCHPMAGTKITQVKAVKKLLDEAVASNKALPQHKDQKTKRMDIISRVKTKRIKTRQDHLVLFLMVYSWVF